jgi:transposase InsO family protein
MRFQFIADHRAEFPVTRLCAVLGVSPSGYYAWCDRPPSAREMANRELYSQIKAVYNNSHGTYGSPRIYRALRRQGVVCSENRVARLMRRHDLRAKQTKRYKATSKRRQADPVAPNLLQRDFTADRPDQKWLTDITYIPTQEGWLYLAVVLDLYSRRIVGWVMAERMTSELTRAALQMSIQQRQPAAELIHHSDQGSQYTAREYQQLLQDQGIQVSMNSVGTWYDNAPVESFFGTLKSEWVNQHLYGTRAEARVAIFYYIEAFYNRQRLHSSLDYLSPVDHEQRYHQQRSSV